MLTRHLSCFGCAQDTCKLTPLGATSNADRFLQELQALQPSTTAVPAIEWQQSSSGSSSTSFDLGSLIAAAQPLQQVPSSTAEPLHGGVLTPSSAYNSSSGSSASSSNTRGSEQQQLLRVVLVYCRSRLPAPVWQTHRQAGLAVDCLHVHDKPQPGEQQHQLQVQCCNGRLASSSSCVVPAETMSCQHSAHRACH